MKTMCFAAGPAKMDESAKIRLSKWIRSNPSIVEMSHRSNEFQKLFQEAKEVIRKLFDVPDEMEILFLSGGSSFQFIQCAQNLLHQKAGYLITGLFSKLAYEAACFTGKCDILYNNSEHPYDLSDFPLAVKGEYDYVYVCINNSLYGTRTPDFICSCPIVADISSCLGIEKLNLERYALAFASAQKNFGISGMTLVFVRKDLNFNRNLPPLISYVKQMEADSLLNTPPVLDIIACKLCAEALLKRKQILYDENRKKAELMYSLLDESSIFIPLVKNHRSMMNISFQMKNEKMESEFLVQCEKNGFTGLKGHKTTGHLRVSFNAHITLDEVLMLIEWMKEQEKHITRL